MSQKIVIKANVKREPQNSVPNVSYEWHWRRIASVSMLVAMTSAAVVYGLTSSVNAEQGEQPNEQSPYLHLSDNTADNVEPTVSVNDEQARPNELTNDIADVAPAVLEDESVNNTSLAQSNNEQTNREPIANVQSNQVSVIEQSDTELAEPIANQPLTSTQLSAPPNEQLPDIENDDGSLTSSEGFSSNAHIASVALGAQIDTGKISRAVLTRKVSKREPTNVFAADIRLNQFEEALSFFSELKNLQGQQVKHVWSYEGETMAEISLNVTSPRYRTYSTKNIMNTQTGHWRVDVVDEQGNLIAQKEFRILAN
ncbi:MULTISPECIES: DUF2914 domain-containing protein [unclassified Pseudoalteromonas]|jgi:hypothetical protein|uniref:DUF2914 domain-containing protein n=1 Tax=unclassified Pseudoalteromonas TaxID=194690 RepID=UPI00235917E8|nr:MULTISPECIES: DUF2914 domain-containing protein [unclassified Pseudoalteromonas]MDC9503650.1 DUF2914 domain-containing protein [Pseudoalteromonas sp. Angola-18]MDC9531551.1 DUF2914 domain-containing protein [Pseudoalteromonas sp. Angola-7]